MSSKTPNFDELVAPEVSGAERDRLRHVHDMLKQAGPPPELSPELEQVPWPEDALQPLGLFRAPRRRSRPRLQIALVAAALLIGGFLIGQALTARSTGFQAVEIVQMKGTRAAPGAIASVAVGRRGTDRNWPMLLSVSNLPPAQDGGYYDLWLSKDGKPQALCGSFNTHFNGDTTVRMSAAYEFGRSGLNGWIIIRHVPGLPESQAPTVLSTTA